MEGDTVKLYYFNLNARVTTARMMLDLAHVKYESIVLTFEEWGKMEKPVETFEYGFLPVLVVNGKAYSQRIAIEHYLGKRLGFFGSNAEEEYQIMNILAAFDDVCPDLSGAFFIKDKEVQAKKFAELADRYLSWILPVFERKFTTRTGKYIVGDKLSVADMSLGYLFWLLRSQPAWSPSIEKYAPKLGVWAEALFANELKETIDHSFQKTAFL